MVLEVHQTALEHGWWDDGVESRNTLELLMLVVCEVAEAAEHYRDGRGVNEIFFHENGKPDGIPIELADVLIRIMDLSAAWGFDLDEAIRMKAEYNKGRPYRHGGKLA